MKINYFATDFFTKRLIKKVFSKCLEMLNQPNNIEIEYALVSPDEIKQINNEQRNKDSATDVLSFPYLQLDAGQVIVESQFQTDINPLNGNILIGDIYICKLIAREQATRYNHSLRREIAFLSLHGLLHLLGYDHLDDKQEQQMNTVAQEVLNAVGVKRK